MASGRRKSQSTTGAGFYTAVLAVGALAAMFVAGFRLGQTMPDADLTPGFAEQLMPSHREAIEAPDLGIPRRVVEPEEFTFYEPRPAREPAPAVAPEAAPVVAPVIAPVVVEPGPADDAAPAVGAEESARVLERTPVVVEPTPTQSPERFERVAVVVSEPPAE